MSRRAASRRSSSGLAALAASGRRFQVREPELDERPHRLFEAGLTRQRERLLVALPHLLRPGALLQPVVARHEELLDSLTRGAAGGAHAV